MNDLISRKALLNELDNENSPYETVVNIEDTDTTQDIINKTLTEYRKILKNMVNNQSTAYDVVDNELRILKNHIEQMPKVYRKRNVNWVIVQNLLMAGTSHAGRTSSVKKCIELGIDAYDYELVVKGAVKDD